MEGVLVTAAGDGIDPCFLLTCETNGRGPKPQYLFNIPEGFARFALEHDVRPGRELRAAFLTDLQRATGISGLIMRLREEGHGSLELIGPEGLHQFVRSLKHFVHWKYPAVMISELGCTSHEEIYEDEYLSVLGIWAQDDKNMLDIDQRVYPDWLERQEKRGNSNQKSSQDVDVLEECKKQSDHNEVSSMTVRDKSKSNNYCGEEDNVSFDTESSGSLSAPSSATSSNTSNTTADSSSVDVAVADKPALVARSDPTGHSCQHNSNSLNMWKLRGQIYKETGETRVNMFERCNTGKQRGKLETPLLGFLCHIKETDKLLFVSSVVNEKSMDAIHYHLLLQILIKQSPERIAGIILMLPPNFELSKQLKGLLSNFNPRSVFVVEQSATKKCNTLGYISSARTIIRLNAISELVFPLPFLLRGYHEIGNEEHVQSDEAGIDADGDDTFNSYNKSDRLIHSPIHCCWTQSSTIPCTTSLVTHQWPILSAPMQMDMCHKIPEIGRILKDFKKTFSGLNLNRAESSSLMNEENAAIKTSNLPLKRSSSTSNTDKRHCSANKSAAAALRTRLVGKSCKEISKDHDDRQFSCEKEKKLQDKLEVSCVPSVTFLGTGCAEPSKYRGASSIYIDFGRSDASGLLLDCGEGSWGQLVRMYGYNEAIKRLSSMKAVWVSHRHADHMSGILQILIQYPLGYPPLLIVGPWALRDWLQDAALPVGVNNKYRFIHAGLLKCNQNHWVKEFLKNSADIQDLFCVPVRHCSDAFGIVLRHQSGWQLVYSGDTEPSNNLVRAGYNANLLIHEATFEPSLESEARRKRHSTTKEAIQVAESMQAQRTILTHFSQRYPKFPEGIMDDSSGDSAAENSLMVAFDGMRVPFDCLEHLPSLTSTIRTVFDCLQSENARIGTNTES